MKFKLLLVILTFIPSLIFAQTAPNLVGTWKGISNSAVYGSGLFHPTEASKEKSVRFRNVEYILIIERQQARNFAGFIGASNNKHPTDIKHKEMILGSFSRDMKSGVMVNEHGTFNFLYIDEKNIELCYAQFKTIRVASCFELTKESI